MTINRNALRRGKQFEKKLVEYFRELGFEVEHNKLVGKDDEGDLAVRTPDFHLLVEAKSPGPGQPLRIPDWFKQVESEAEHYAAARRLDIRDVVPVVMVERVGDGLDETWVVLRLSQFAG